MTFTLRESNIRAFLLLVCVCVCVCVYMYINIEKGSQTERIILNSLLEKGSGMSCDQE